MSRTAKITLPFADGKYDFLLDIGQLEELQELTDAGPEELYRRIRDGNWRVKDLTQSHRLGLIGAGMEPTRALLLTERYCAAAYLAECKAPAQAMLAAALIGAPDEDPKKDADLGEGAAEEETS